MMVMVMVMVMVVMGICTYIHRSTGCVVLEMVQGKRPWAELQSNYQIMFKVGDYFCDSVDTLSTYHHQATKLTFIFQVGMGQSPSVPSHLSDEGIDQWHFSFLAIVHTFIALLLANLKQIFLIILIFPRQKLPSEHICPQSWGTGRSSGLKIEKSNFNKFDANISGFAKSQLCEDWVRGGKSFPSAFRLNHRL